MNVKFDSIHERYEPNKVLIALSGVDIQEMADRLEQIANQIRHSKPIQCTTISYGLNCSVITPIWNDKNY